ncbi:MAG: hypothetical protein B6241_02670 [Spirochaetaceae bacterium 4572_59]|nr:MAG: hypothetical protein B6241_02670 [Spirochaetaceae bacterium 4572_59]
MKQTIEDVENNEELNRSMWLYPLIRGGIITVAGILLIVFPKIGPIFLSAVFGLYLLVLGIGQTVLSFKLSGSRDRWWQLLIRGGLLIIAAVLILWYPFSFAKIGMGIPLVVGGLFLIINSLQDLLSPSFQNSGSLSRFGSIFMIILGVLLCFAPVFSALLLFRFIGLFSLAGGIFLIQRALSFR